MLLKRSAPIPISYYLLIGVSCFPPACGYGFSQAKSAPAHQSAASAYVSLPLAFEPNAGQTGAQVDFLARGSSYSVWLANGDALLALKNAGGGHVVRLVVVGANADSKVGGEQRLDSKSNYLVGSQDQWHTDIPNYGAVKYDNVYNGIDLRYYGNQRQLEYDFIVNAGADPNTIRLDFLGGLKTEIAANGDLLLTLNEQGKLVRFRAPVAYQDAEGGRESVACRYFVLANGQVGFELGMYDTSRQLIIDPVLDYGTYLGGTGNDNGNAVAVDTSGNAYITGYTVSAGFPTTAGAYDTTISSSCGCLCRQVERQWHGIGLLNISWWQRG